jgi:aspartate/methionine/tyrosine aminotransferase
LRNRQKLSGRNINIIVKNLSILDDFFKAHSKQFSWSRPRAGSMTFPRYLAGNVDIFCDNLVRQAGVLLLPGSVYDDINNHFRLGVGRKNLPLAIMRLNEFLEKRY